MGHSILEAVDIGRAGNLFFQRLVLQVLDDADNLEFLAVLSITPAEFLTDGIAIGKEISRHRLIDACDPWGGVGVGRQKLAARSTRVPRVWKKPGPTAFR